MTLGQRLLEAAELKLLRPLDVQFALMVAKDEHPAVMLAAAMLSRDTGKGTSVCRSPISAHLCSRKAALASSGSSCLPKRTRRRSGKRYC